MVGGIGRSGRCNAGGIVSLAEFTTEHHKALEYELMRCGYQITDIGRSLSWGALRSFIERLGPDSAVAREVDPEVHEWSTRLKTNIILADIFDMLALINANIVAVGSHKATKKPKTYPRPKGYGGENGKHYGSKPVSVRQLRAMFASNRKRHKHGKQ